MATPANYFKPGNPGRPKGALNKRTNVLNKILEGKGFCPVTNIMTEYENLSAEDRVTVCLRLMEFIYPKRKAIAVTSNVNDLMPQNPMQALAEIVDFKQVAQKRLDASNDKPGKNSK